MKAAWCSQHGEALRLSVQVLPNAKKTEVVGLIDGALKIRLKAQPIEGQANEELIRFIATQIKLPKKPEEIETFVWDEDPRTSRGTYTTVQS